MCVNYTSKTKAVVGEVLDGHLQRMGFEPRGGRAEKATQLNIIKKSKSKEENQTEDKEKNNKEEDEVEKNVVSPQCVRVHDFNGKQVKGKRWVTGLTRKCKGEESYDRRPVRVARAAGGVISWPVRVVSAKSAWDRGDEKCGSENWWTSHAKQACHQVHSGYP